MTPLNSGDLAFEKMSGLIPAIIQDANTGKVLTLAYMNQEALELSQSTGSLVLYSRSRQSLWFKGETSGNTMAIVAISKDCDQDALLVQVNPKGPACHLGFDSCFQAAEPTKFEFLSDLIMLIAARRQEDSQTSYTAELFRSGILRCAQKVGEEATETVIAAVTGDQNELVSEAADLLFHLLVLLEASRLDFYAVLDCLQRRHNSKVA